MQYKALIRTGIGIIVLCLLLVACSGQGDEADQAAEEGGVYRPPPAAPQTPLVIPLPTPTPTASNLSQGFSPTATPSCVDDLHFVEDLTIPDGSSVPPGETIDKRWLVNNAGTCNWGASYRLRLIKSPEGLDMPQELALYPARGGTQAVIRLLFSAPNQPGTYRSAWQAYNPQGEPFGDTLFVEFAVAASP